MDRTVVMAMVRPSRRRGVRRAAAVAAVAALASSLFVLAFGSFASATPAPVGSVSVVARGVDQPEQIVTGADGNLWFTNGGGSSASIGRITTAGVVTMFTTDVGYPGSLAAGPDGNVWYTDSTGSIRRVTPAGVATQFTDPSIDQPRGITAGADGNL